MPWIGSTWTWAWGTSKPAMIRPIRSGWKACCWARPIRCDTCIRRSFTAGGEVDPVVDLKDRDDERCPGCNGLIDRNAAQWSSRQTNRPGSSPSMIRVKIVGMGESSDAAPA